jgi:hypothetical protein
MNEARGDSHGTESLEERVRKVRHLDPFTLVQHADGRFSAELTMPVEDLDPSVAEEILDELEPVLRRLRRRVES